jgi:hypothetical protein
MAAPSPEHSFSDEKRPGSKEDGKSAVIVSGEEPFGEQSILHSLRVLDYLKLSSSRFRLDCLVCRG